MPSRSPAMTLIVCALLACGGLAGCDRAPDATDADGVPPPGEATAATAASDSMTDDASAAVRRATEIAEQALPPLVSSFGVPGIEDGQITLPWDVALDGAGNLYISDSTGVQKFDAQGDFLLRFDPGVLANGRGIAVTDDGTLYVTGQGAQVLVYGPDGGRAGEIGEAGTGPGQLSNPMDVALDGAGNLYVVDPRNSRVEKFSPDGRHLLGFGEPGQMRHQLSTPTAVAVDDQGRIYVAMGDHFLFKRFSPEGEYIDSLGQSHAGDTAWRTGGLALDDAGHVFASQTLGPTVQCFGTGDDTGLVWEFGELGAGPHEFSSPTGLAVAEGKLYVADHQNNRIQVYALR